MADLSRFQTRQPPQKPKSARPTFDDIETGLTGDQARANMLDDTVAPAAARRAMTLGAELGYPAAGVSADVPSFEVEAKQRDADDRLSRNPALASWFAKDPLSAAASQDDLPALDTISNIFNGGINDRFKGRLRSSTATPYTLGMRADANKLFPGKVGTRAPEAPQRQGRRATAVNVAKGLIAGQIAGLSDIARFALTNAADEFGMRDEFLASDYYKRMRSDADRLDAVADVRYDPLGKIGGFDINPGQWAYGATTSMIQTLGALGLGKKGLLALATISGADQAVRTQDRGGGALESTLAGVGSGAIEYVTEKLPFGDLLGKLGKEGAGKFLLGYLGKEIVGEQAATIGQNLIDATTTGGKGFEQYKADLPQELVDTLGTTLFMGAGMGAINTVGRRLSPQVRAMDDIEHAATGAGIVDHFMAQAEQSKLKGEAPETFKAFVDHAIEQSGAPVRDLYIPVEAINELMQSEGYEPETLAPYAEQIAEAQATQGDVVIPIADAAAFLGGTPTWEALKDSARLQPGGISLKEGREQHSEIMATLEQRGAEIAAEVAEGETAKSAAAEVYTDVKNRLLAGKVASTEAEAVAQIAAARYETRATKLGVTPMQAWQDAKVSFDWEGRQRAEGEREVAQEEPLAGLPQQIKVDGKSRTFGPYRVGRQAAAKIAKRLGIAHNPPTTYARVDPDRAARIATEFELMEHNPSDPEVKAAYQAMIDETVEQYKELMKTGLKVEFITGADPYGNPRNAIIDVVENNHLWVYPTDAGFGGASATLDVSDNPLLQIVPGIKISGQLARANDIFRVVHDFFGHIMEGVGFRADGEENAWRIHSAMYSPLARRAMTTETRGQNSWVNFGPFGEKNRTASGSETEYAAQKIGLLPEWVSEEGLADRTLEQSAALGGYEGLSAFLNDDEKDGLREAAKAKILSIAESLPDAEEMAAVALAGRAKRGWYENSAQAILDVFGAEDAPRFAALLAALSPQTSVESNLFNALKTWTNWNEAGRPTDRGEIIKVMGASVQGGKGVGSVLTAWINNSVTALQAENPAQIKLSGPKVDSFMNNLVGVVDEVTNDAWMSNYAGVDPALLAGRKFPKAQGMGDAKGKGPGYKAMSAVVRAAADVLTSKTGELWTPAEVQETVWSFAKTLYEARDVAGEKRDMRALLEAGRVTHDDIANTPDFAILFADGVYRTILEEAGYGEKTKSLGRNRRAVGVDGQESIGARPEGSGFTEDAYRQFLGQAADRLESVRAARRAPTEGAQRELFQDVLPEAGWTPERISGLIDLFEREDGSTNAIAAMMSPDEFLGINASAEGRRLIEERVTQLPQYGGELDVAQLAKSDPISLTIAVAGEPSAFQRSIGVEALPGMVAGHVGRHRMMLLKRAGVTQVPVVVVLTQKGKDFTVTEPFDIPSFIGNRSRGDQTAIGDGTGSITKGIPISQKYHQQLSDMGGRVLFQEPQPIFYSALERAISESKTAKAPAAQWIATLRKVPGVRQEELEWSGLLEFLEQADQSVTREQLATLLAEGGVQVEEVMLGQSNEEAIKAQLRRENPDWSEDEVEQAIYDGDAEMLSGTDAPQFKSWSSDPRNESYRELLITLPVATRGNPSRAPSTHWDTEGVVAHARFMDKVDADGKRVLFIEEVQSDWHQKGRDQGYETKVDAKTVAAAWDKMEAAEQAWAAAVQARYDGLPDKGDTAYILGGADKFNPRDSNQVGRLSISSQIYDPDDANGLSAAVMAARELRDLTGREYDIAKGFSTNGGVPNAPFKSSWPALVMKRMIRYAAENGYERVAWTTGKEQSERYNLSQAVGRIEVMRGEDGRYLVDVIGGAVVTTLVDNGLAERTGKMPYPMAMTEAQMREAFGNDIAQKAVDGAAADPDGIGLDGSDLNVGGEGMRAFYDRNLVNITNDIVKKYGAKVGKLDLRPARLVNHKAEFAPQVVAAKAEAVALRKEFEAYRAAQGGVQPQTLRDDPVAQEINDRYLAAAKRYQDVFEAAKKSGGTNPGFDVTDKMRDAALQGLPLFQDKAKPRGSVSFLADGGKLISLFETANRSTLIHEFSHVWLEEIREDALREGATAQDKADWAALKRWWKSLGIVVTDKGQIPTNAHEYFARGGERYTMEGKAPSAALGGTFKRFTAWLTRIYEVVSNLNAPINDEIRQVFDRLLATQEAIDAYAEQSRVAPLFKSATEAGMTDDEFAAYQRSVDEARDEAFNSLLFKTMEGIRRKRTVEMREKLGNIRAEIAEAINGRPEFIALHLLRTGRWLGDPDRERADVKLNTGWLIDTFGEDILNKLPKGLPISRGDGQEGDEIAEMVGAASGQELVHALVGMRVASEALRASGETRSLRDKMIADEVERVAAERFGDMFTDGSIEEEAIAALNTARQGEIIAGEIRQLGKRASLVSPQTPYQFAREWAKRKIAAGLVRDVASRAAVQRYIRGTAKAARAAETAILEGDVDEAYRQKQAQLLQHALLAESKKAADEVDTIVARLKKYANRAAMKSVDQDYMDKVHMLLENYDLRTRTLRSIDEQEGFQKWAEDQRAKGFEVHIPPRLENRGVPFSKVTVEELLSLNDVVQSLIHLGKTKQKIKTAQGERDFAELVDEAVATVERLPQRKLPDDPVAQEKRWLASGAAELLKVETIVEELDGGRTGPFNDVLIVGAANAENKRTALRDRVMQPIADAYRKLSRRQWKRYQEKVTIPELTWNTLNEGDPRIGQPVTLTRLELISMTLNTGNLSNLEKLSKGERWPVATIRAVADRELNKEDWDFVQLLWTQVNALWPDIVATERELSGVVPEQVVATPIETRFGTYEGGYWPVVYDAARWQRAEDLEGMRADDMFGIKSGVATQKGHTITRTEAFGPMSFNLENVLFQHLEAAVTRIAFSSFARDMLRFIKHPRVAGIIDTRLGSEYRKQFEPWLGRQIQEGATDTRAARWWGQLLKQARINMTIAAMGFRFSTGIAQTLGLTASAQRIGARYVGAGMKRLATNPRKMAQFVFDRSPEMVNRNSAVNREVSEVFSKMRGKHSLLTEAQAMAFWHIGMIDRYVVSIPTWLGAHQRGLDQGMSDEEASRDADKAVRMSQGAGGAKDLSRIQGDQHPAMRFFTLFYTPFNVMFNAQWQGVRGLKKGELGPLIGVTFWWMIVSTLGDALLGGDEPDWEDETAVLGWFGRNVGFGMFAGIPLVRDLAGGTERKVSGEYADIGATPVTRVYDSIEKVYRIGDKLATEGETPKRPLKQVADLTALLTGTPVSQFGTTGQFLWDYQAGEADPQSISDWYFGITRGKVPEQEAE